jgi:hypothetical protein
MMPTIIVVRDVGGFNGVRLIQARRQRLTFALCICVFISRFSFNFNVAILP